MNVIRSRVVVGLTASTLLASGLTLAAVAATSAGPATATFASAASHGQCANVTQIDACPMR
jgi:hypothetical protein